MSAPDIGPEVMKQFAALAEDAHLTIVLGAGASAPSGLPQWDTFAVRLAVLSGLVGTEEAASTLLRKQDPAIVLEAAHYLAGERWPKLLHTALYSGSPSELAPSPLHLAAAGHLVRQPTRTTVATLNFDTLLEDAVLEEGEGLVAIGTDGTEDPDVRTVHHLHGALLGDAAGDLDQSVDPIVGYRDFAELVADPDAWQFVFLFNALQRGPLLLAGTSYRDPDLRHWLHLILRENAPEHAAMVTIVREGLGLGREEFAAIEKALAVEWQSIGLTALTMQDVSDVALVLRELNFLGEPGYLAPRDRVREAWRAHARRFSRVQEEFLRALSVDSARVAEAVGVPTRRGSIWLADGHGRLARWATAGQRYDGPQDLKRVPTGHDSPWIAGEAIATEEVKLKDVARDPSVRPTWQSVLAIPVFIDDGRLPAIASAVLTFGLEGHAESLQLRQREWRSVTADLSEAWGTRLSTVAFPTRPTTVG